MIEYLSREDDGAWETFVDAHPLATPYHGVLWRDVVTRCFRHEPKYFVSKNPEGRITGVFPCFLLRNPLGARMVSASWRGGGPLAADEESLRALLAAAAEETKRQRCAYLEVKTGHGEYDAVFEQAGYQKLDHWVHTAAQMKPDTEAMWESLAKSELKRAIRKGEKSGVTVEAADSAKDTEDFYHMFLRARRELGVPAYPPEFFEAIREILIPAKRAVLFFAVRGGARIAASIFLLHHKTLHFSFSASRRDMLEYRPNDVLMWDAIKWGIASGCDRMDFGVDSPLQESLLKFKEKWGAARKVFPFHYYLNTTKEIPLVDTDGPKYLLVRNVFRRMPLPLFEAVGNRFARWIM